MPQFTQKITLAHERLTADNFGVTGRIVVYDVAMARLDAADRANDQLLILSANVSAQTIAIAPLGVSAQPLLIFLCTDQPIDIRTNAASDTTFLSAVRLWVMAGHISGLYVTTGSADTALMLKVAGGSNASLQATLPFP